MFFKVGVLKHFAIFTANHGCNFIKKRLKHSCFPVNIAKVLRTLFFTEHLQWLLVLLVLFRTNYPHYLKVLAAMNLERLEISENIQKEWAKLNQERSSVVRLK